MSGVVSYLPMRRVAASKLRLLEAGIKLFTQNAGQGLTSRELAREAKVNHALINYHFGGMAELLNAVVDRCIQDLQDMLLPELERFGETVRAEPREKAPDLLREHMAVLLGVLSGPKGEALLKALSGPDSAMLRGVYARFSDHVLQPMHLAFATVAAKLRDVPERSLEASVLAQLMVAEAMAFFRGGRLVLAHLGLDGFNPSDREAIGRIAAEALCRTAGSTE